MAIVEKQDADAGAPAEHRSRLHVADVLVGANVGADGHAIEEAIRHETANDHLREAAHLAVADVRAGAAVAGRHQNVAADPELKRIFVFAEDPEARAEAEVADLSAAR